MADRDDFDAALEDAIEAPDRENEIDIDLDDDHDDDAPSALRADEGGGDIDEPSPLDRASTVDAQISQAATVTSQWKAELDAREAKLKEAQAKYLQIRKDVLNGKADDDAELAAQDAVLELRYQVDKAKDSYGQAQAWHESLASQPKLTPAQQSWLSANPRYNTDPAFAKQAQRVMSELAEQGFDPGHAAFYKRLDDKLRSTPRMGADSRRAPGVPAIRTSRTDPTRGEAQMSKGEAKFIQRLGYDPSDKHVQAQWKQSKANTRRVAQKRGFL
jgi:hypothetical protein